MPPEPLVVPEVVVLTVVPPSLPTVEPESDVVVVELPADDPVSAVLPPVVEVDTVLPVVMLPMVLEFVDPSDVVLVEEVEPVPPVSPVPPVTPPPVPEQRQP